MPNEVKDKYDDKNYNQIRPYNQVFNSVIRDYSFLVLMRQISAASKALRNSDFVQDSQLKVNLLNSIISGWNEINKLLIIMSPLPVSYTHLDVYKRQGLLLRVFYATI